MLVSLVGRQALEQNMDLLGQEDSQFELLFQGNRIEVEKIIKPLE